MKKERTTERLNNYIHNKYFYKKKKKENGDGNRIGCADEFHYQYPDFTVKTSIDFFTLSIKENADQHTLRDILTSIGFKSIRNDLLDKGNYQMKWKFENPDTGITAEVFYASKKLHFPPIQLKIHDPDQGTVNLLHQNFIEKEINFNLSYVELTFDFFTDEVVKLRELLKSITFMNNARSKPCRKKTTYYLNDLRKSVRGIRIYTRKCWDHVRMEVTLKSEILKRLGLSFPLDSIDSLDLTRFFLFRIVDQEKLRRYLIRSCRKLIESSEKKRQGYGNLVVCQIQSWINCIVMDAHGDMAYLMDQVSAFRSEDAVPCLSRFMIPLDDFSVDFMKQVSCQKFLRGK